MLFDEMGVELTHIEFPVFSNYIVHVEVTSNFEKAVKKYPATEVISDDDISNSAGITIFVRNSNLTFIFLKPNASVGVIAHESLSAAVRRSHIT
jgi:hypothetical protein